MPSAAGAFARAALLGLGATFTWAAEYDAEVRRTNYGIVHVKADDWGGLGYGYGYAYAADNFCVAMRGIVGATGRSAEFFGEDEGDLRADFVLRFLFGDKEAFRESFLPDASRPAAQLFDGFAAGMNRYLRDTGVAQLPEDCRGAEWVEEVDAVDIGMLLARVALQGSSDQSTVRNAIYNASTPGAGSPPAPPAVAHPPPAHIAPAQLERAKAALRDWARELGNTDRGSNALAIGRDFSRTGKGMLLGNPHQPWHGTGSFYQVHLTIPGELDVAGASLHAMPFVGIGFNRDIAWTHTVAFSTRFTVYQMPRNAANARQYAYDGGFRDLASETITVQVRLDDGTLESRSRTFHSTHQGPLGSLADVDPLLHLLTAGTFLAIRDANVGRYAEMVEQYLSMAQADGMDTFTAALAGIGIPVFHTLAADRDGNAFYGEVAAVPALTAETHLSSQCISGPVPLLARIVTNDAVLVLDGAKPACEWGQEVDSPAGSNVAGYRSRPKLLTTDYVGNSNDSPWLSNPEQPLTGFPSTFGWLGRENAPQLLRTRLGHLMVAERRAAADGLARYSGFNLGLLKRFMYRNRVYAAELVLDDVLAVCRDIPRNALTASPNGRAHRACDVLRDWDRHVNADSRGAQVFTAFWREIWARLANYYTNAISNESFWRVDFDPRAPLTTPRGIDLAIAANRELVLDELSDAVLRLDAAGVALDAPWGEVQYFVRRGRHIAVHGGDGNMGVYGAISAGLADGGYTEIGAGNSYLQAVTWDDSACPIADTMLVSGQSDNPKSYRYRDQAIRYAKKLWVRFPFCEPDIKRRQLGETLRLVGS